MSKAVSAGSYRGLGGQGTERVCGGAVGFATALLGLPWGNGKVVGRVLELEGGSEPRLIT